MLNKSKSVRIEDLKVNLSNDYLKRTGRILIIDDEKPEIIEHLNNAGFAVNYTSDITSTNLNLIEGYLFDLILLDFKDVGLTIGKDEGLSILKHTKGHNPATIVFAYTSKLLPSEQSGFYTLSDGSLSKDAGIGETIEKIEEGLRKALSPINLWKGLIQILNVKSNSDEDIELQQLFIKSLKKQSAIGKFKNHLSLNTLNDPSKKVLGIIIEKLIEIGIKIIITAI